MAFQGLSSTITFMKNNADAIFYRAFQRHCPILHINKADTGADICYMSMLQHSERLLTIVQSEAEKLSSFFPRQNFLFIRLDF